jgi:hypothetical protein
MAIVEDVTEQMKAAMRAKDKERLGALRMMRSAFIEAMKASGEDTLDDAAAVAILRRLAKQRRESIEAFIAGARPELAEAEQAELVVIEAYLPSLADAETTRAWVVAAVAQTGASGPGDMGRVMGAVMGAHKGEVDGKLVKDIALELLKP